MSSAERMRGSQRAFCSSLPCAISVGAMSFCAMIVMRSGAPDARYSSSKIAWVMTSAPRPPYSVGQAMPPYPATDNVRSHSRCCANPSAVPYEVISRGTCAESHARTSARNASCSGAKERSMPPGC
jgi:hypothetical protein